MLTVRFPAHFPLRVTEWLLASIKTTWGVVLLQPTDVFANPIFSALGRIASQDTWGWVSLIFGTMHLVALYVNGARRRSPHLRAACSAIGSFFWFQVTLGLIGSGIISTGWAVYPWLFIASVYNVIRAMLDARASDDRARGDRGGIA